MIQVFLMGLSTAFAISLAIDKKWAGMWFQLCLVMLNACIYLLTQ